MNTRKMRMAALVLAAGLSGTAQAALHDRGGGLIYDDVLNVTWLQDANYAKTSGYDADGWMTWPDSKDWAANLNYYDVERGVSYDDWRLPSTLQFDLSCEIQSGASSYGIGCTGSEMGHLFYADLGGVAGIAITLAHNANYNLFQNIEANYYWSGTGYPPNNTYHAWAFITLDGYQGWYFTTLELSAWAVRDGDVAAVPEAETYGMMLAGLGLVSAMARRRKQTKI
jgi:hypothetical protein